MKPYSQTLRRRVMGLGLGFMMLLGVVIYFRSPAPSLDSGTLFTPLQQIALVQHIHEVLNSPTIEQPSASKDVLSLPCQERGSKVLQTRIMSELDVSAKQAYALMKASIEHLSTPPSCSRWVYAFQTAMALRKQNSNAKLASPALIANELSEDVSWSRSLPCVMASDLDRDILLSGNPLACSSTRSVSSASHLPKNSSLRLQAQSVSSAVTVAAIAGNYSPNGSVHISLNPTIQALFDAWTNCRLHQKCSDYPALGGLKNLAIVVMDARRATIVGSWCDGPTCQQMQRLVAGAIPATLMEAPPASTAKLFFALDLASSPQTEVLMLQRQIKTSGQIDAMVRKRNEWWERQAICDTHPGRDCAIPHHVKGISNALGFNHQCETSANNCGRYGLVSHQSKNISPGMLGRLSIAVKGSQQVPMIPWTQYNDIRLGKRKPNRGDQAYTNTSQTVQSVIGAGNNRISALGLAVLSMQIWRLAHDLSPAYPTIITPSSKGPQAVEANAQTPSQKSAQAVLNGMKKVIQPAESGWAGDGTASSAFKQALSIACRTDCGLAAKTGTVSLQDKVFGGTTLFTGVIDGPAFKHWLDANQLTKVQSVLFDSTYTIGVIAMPSKTPIQRHAASQIAMTWVKAMLIGAPVQP